MRKLLILILKVLALTIVMFLCFAGAGILVSLQAGTAGGDQGSVTGPLLLACLLNTIILAYLIIRSRWWGWRLIAAVFVAFYGTMTLMSQMETAVFVTRLPAGTLPRLFLAGLLVAAPFSFLAVVVLRRGRADGTLASAHSASLGATASEWAWKLSVVMLAYLLLYFGFGYFVAWRNPELRAYYGGSDEGSFLAQMAAVLGHRPWLVPFQMARALLWTAIAWPLMRMTAGGRLEASVALGCVFAVLMTSMLLIPNPLMPETVRHSHILEIAPSNFLFGMLIGGLLAPRRASYPASVSTKYRSTQGLSLGHPARALVTEKQKNVP